MTERSNRSRLGQLMADFRDIALEGKPEKVREHIAGTTRQAEGLRSESRFGDLAMTIDEPVYFGGTGLAPNPAETLLAALGASLEVTLRCFAEYWGYRVDGISVALSGDLDTRAFFGTEAGLRPGFRILDVQVTVDSPESTDRLALLFDRVERSCPVLDIVRGDTPINLSFDAV